MFEPPKKQDSFNRKLSELHDEVKGWLPSINRIAVALYDRGTGVLKTFIHSSDDGSPLDHYQAKLAKVKSLQDIADSQKPRVINDLTVLKDSKSIHTRKIVQQDYKSSFTSPIIHNGEFFGFVFFNASEVGYFTDSAVHNLSVYAQLIGLLCITEFNAIRTLQAAVKTAREISQYRDEETGFHLMRMSNFSRLIALDLADEKNLSDEFIEYMFHFASLHDIGKIAIPDQILLKAGPFSDEERAIMKTHVEKGIEIISKMVDGFQMEHLPKISMLKNIVQCHHEAMDGSGYPQGLKGKDIPLEARIVSVADVFDALTSERPYKKAWTNEEAFTFLDEKTPNVFDLDCVNALKRQRDQVEEIQQRFHEDIIG
ncbi:MAG: HD domain-containing protein [Magnetovibrio sp.]|nr:HD domain-containing protein [Magnetovibrio sp.]